MRMVNKTVLTLNGISIAYLMAVVNAGFVMLTSYGINISQQEVASTVIFLNVSLVAIAHFSHRLGESEAAKNIASGLTTPEAIVHKEGIEEIGQTGN